MHSFVDVIEYVDPNITVDTAAVGLRVSAIVRALRRNPTVAEMSVAGLLRPCPETGLQVCLQTPPRSK